MKIVLDMDGSMRHGAWTGQHEHVKKHDMSVQHCTEHEHEKGNVLSS